MKELQQSITLQLYDHWKDLPDTGEQHLCQSAIKAMELSYSPYSKFAVGAALRLSDDHIVSGNNQENAVYPLGQCAERVALYAATSQYNLPVTALAVATKEVKPHQLFPPFPCGSCRQVMLEVEERYQQPMKVMVVSGDHKVAVIASAKEMLPFAFTKECL